MQPEKPAPGAYLTLALFFGMAGTPLGSMLIVVMGGYMAMHYDWRAVFLAVASALNAPVVIALAFSPTLGVAAEPVARGCRVNAWRTGGRR